MKVYDYTISEEQLSKHFEEQEILYRDYKSYSKPYQHFAQKKGSYNAENKTIVLYVPKYIELAEKISEAKRNFYIERRGEVPRTSRTEADGCFGYETDSYCGRQMMNSATWWAIIATEEDLQTVLDEPNPAVFKKMYKTIVELVREYRANID